MAQRVCSECPTSLAGKQPQTKTCSQECRQARSRRLRRNKQAGGKAKALPEHQKQIEQVVRGQAPDVARHVVEEELRPVIREAITDEVVQSLGRLVALTPRVVQLLEQDMEDPDPVVRQRAYTLITKYTMGHPAVMNADDLDDTKKIEVHFNLPRPGDPGAVAHVDGSSVELETDEWRTCDVCGHEKLITDFIAKSDRCVTCYQELQDKAASLYKDSDEDDTG